MFNTDDKITLIVMAFNENEQQLSFYVKMPIEDSENFTLPNNTDYISLCQIGEISNNLFGNTLFSIYTGNEILGEKISYYSKNFKVKIDKKIKTNIKNLREKRLCCEIDLGNKNVTIKKVLKPDDRVVESKEGLETLTIQISEEFKKIKDSVGKIKSLGKK